MRRPGGRQGAADAAPALYVEEGVPVQIDWLLVVVMVLVSVLILLPLFFATAPDTTSG